MLTRVRIMVLLCFLDPISPVQWFSVGMRNRYDDDFLTACLVDHPVRKLVYPAPAGIRAEPRPCLRKHLDPFHRGADLVPELKPKTGTPTFKELDRFT